MINKERILLQQLSDEWEETEKEYKSKIDLLENWKPRILS
jgi:hypothetical protein